MASSLPLCSSQRRLGHKEGLLTLSSNSCAWGIPFSTHLRRAVGEVRILTQCEQGQEPYAATLPFPRYKAGAGWCVKCVAMDLTHPKGSLAPAMSTLLCQLTDGRDQAWVCKWQVNLFVGEEDYMGLLKPSPLWFLAGARGKWLVATGKWLGRRETHSDFFQVWDAGNTCRETHFLIRRRPGLS